jgi:hypothetical protein
MIAKEKLTAVYWAIANGDLEETRRLFADQPCLLDPLPLTEEPWVMLAVGYRQTAIVDFLLEIGCDVNADDHRSKPPRTALHAAISNDDLILVSLLLEHGANPNKGQVLSAVSGNRQYSLEMLKLLEQYGADLHRVFANEQTDSREPINALSWAIAWGREDIAGYLRSKGAVLPTRLSSGSASPLHETMIEAGRSGDVERARQDKCLNQEIIDHFAGEFGPVQRLSLMEIVPGEPAITVHVIPASKDRNHRTLFTTGMSAQPMTVPEGNEDYQYAELFVQLPADWEYMKIEDPNYGWPIHWLRSTAKHPFQHNTWLGGPATIVANGDPPQPLAPNTRFTSHLFLAEKSFVASDGKKIRLYRMIPLYTEERTLEIREGIAALLHAFREHGVSFVVDLKRPCVA